MKGPVDFVTGHPWYGWTFTFVARPIVFFAVFLFGDTRRAGVFDFIDAQEDIVQEAGMVERRNDRAFRLHGGAVGGLAGELDAKCTGSGVSALDDRSRMFCHASRFFSFF